MSGTHARFSVRRFLLRVALQHAALVLSIRLLFPEFWARQMSAGVGAFVTTFLVVLLCNSFFEWFFHRYVLHATIHPWLVRFARSHRHHHSLTAILLRENPTKTGRIVINRYPITEPIQFEASAFPGYALLVFWIIFAVPLTVAQALLPDAPVIVAGLSAVTWSLVSYEVFHAVEHYPYEWWKSAVEHPRLGWFWRRVYGFHHFHHANVSANEAISGFFGLPIPDWVFRTYHQPEDLLLEGRLATAKEFKVRPGHPWTFVARLDSWARHREAIIRKKYPERFDALSPRPPQGVSS
jgi:hemolysin III